jgi:hypothetical protein
MHAFFPTRPEFADSLAWPSAPAANSMNHVIPGPLPPPAPPLPDRERKDDLRARNKVAAKKWRDKKDETLSDLEGKNDQLRAEALDLRKQLMSLKTENHVLEDELKFFQSFMTKIMKVSPQESFAPGTMQQILTRSD